MRRMKSRSLGMGGSRGEGKSSFEPTPSRGEGKSSGSQYPLRPSSGIGGGGGKDSDSDSDSDGGPPGRPSRPGSRPQSLADHNSAGSKDTNDGPTIKMSRSKSKHISFGDGAGGLMLHGIWLGAFTADYDMISDILKDQPEMINEKSRRVDNKTPLMLACQAGDPKCIELLLNKGAELDAADVFGRTALMLASKYDFPNVVTLLLNRDSTLMHAVSENNMDALMYATDSGAMRAVQVLMNHAPNLNELCTGGEHFMRTVKEIAQAKIEESPTEEVFPNILKILNGETPVRKFPTRSRKMNRRISGNGCKLLMESFSVGDDACSGSNEGSSRK